MHHNQKRRKRREGHQEGFRDGVILVVLNLNKEEAVLEWVLCLFTREKLAAC